MNNPGLKKTIFISLLGHITVFGIFSLSFGSRIPKADYATVSFWGQFLYDSQVIKPLMPTGADLSKNFIRADASTLNKITKESPILPSHYLKPSFILAFNSEKQVFTKKSPPMLFSAKKREPMIIFHPLLPYSFTLYFKDRQIAHVELMFNMSSSQTRNSLEIKRKISSGNLEVDLLSMRYIGHYFFIQHPRFSANNWQTVKIDLTANND
jgi:hypothetical protein